MMNTQSPSSEETEAIDAARSGTLTLGGDLNVNRICYGAMRLTGSGIWGEPRDPSEAIRVLRRTAELGINLIDTADSYGPEVSERLIAEALHPYRDDLVIATKGGFVRFGPDEWQSVGRPEYLRQCVEMSLRRLRLDRIDLWQLHRIDPTVPVEDSLEPILRLQEQGKIRHIGLSEVKPAEIERVLKFAKIVSVQNQFNIGDRQHEDTVRFCEANGIAFIPFFPVAAGALAARNGPLARAAQQHGATVSQLALAWLLHHSPAILPIPGTSSVKHLEENTASALVHLTADEWNDIEASIG